MQRHPSELLCRRVGSWFVFYLAWTLIGGPSRLTAEKVIASLGHQGDINAVVFSRDGGLLASGGEDRLIRVWRPDLQQLERVLGGHTGAVNALAFSPDGKLLVSGSSDRTVRLWDRGSGLAIASLQPSTTILAVAISPDGRLLASAGYDKTVVLWRLDTRQQARVLNGHTSWVHALAFHPDGEILASGGDHTCRASSG